MMCAAGLARAVAAVAVALLPQVLHLHVRQLLYGILLQAFADFAHDIANRVQLLQRNSNNQQQ